MSPGRHAADDGSFGRSASGAMARGIALIVVAVLLGVILLRATDSPEVGDVDTGPLAGARTTTTSAPTASAPSTTTTTALDPSTIIVLVANGAGVSGLAGDLTTSVAEAGFETVDATDVLGDDVETSTVYYTSGFQQGAEAVAELFDGVPDVAVLPDPAPVADLAGANVVVVAGADLVPE